MVATHLPAFGVAPGSALAASVSFFAVLVAAVFGVVFFVSAFAALLVVVVVGLVLFVGAVFFSNGGAVKVDRSAHWFSGGTGWPSFTCLIASLAGLKFTALPSFTLSNASLK